MPAKSLNSRAIVWPKKDEVISAFKKWAEKLPPDFKKVGYFGSYSKGNWGPGSDIDIILVVQKENKKKLSIDERVELARKIDASELPVPADIFIYTEEELEKLKDSPMWRKILSSEVVWIR